MKLQLKTRKMIIITSLVLVFLCLLGLTYAYFVTKIKGNTNTNSVKITTATLKIVYDDGNSDIAIDKVKPGEKIPEKNFSISNTSDGRVDDYSIYIEVLSNTLERPYDLTYSITCESYDINTNEFLENCDGVNDNEFPKQDDLAIINSIDKDVIQRYNIKIKYNETGTNQSIDMNKNVLAKIQLYNLSNFDIGTFAFKTVNNASKGFNGTTFVKRQIINPGISISPSNISNMSIAKDDYGTSFYYYGNVKNNYVSFNNMCWRILRINGNGTIKLILSDSEATCSSSLLTKTTSAFIKSTDLIDVPYNTINDVNYNESNLKTILENWYRTKFTNATIVSKLYKENWCNDKTVLNSETYTSKRLSLEDTTNSSPSLKCNDKTLSSYIGTITSDEVVFAGAGGSSNDITETSFLTNNANGTYWTMSPESIVNSTMYKVFQNGSFTTSITTESSYVRPIIVLNNDVSVSGNGTIEKPYIIE